MGVLVDCPDVANQGRVLSCISHFFASVPLPSEVHHSTRVSARLTLLPC